jgi:outer membrane phospholipase A
LTLPAEAASASENTDKAAGAESSEAGASDTESASTKYPSLDSLLVRHQPYLENISAYKPMYFLVGTDPEDSKFQFSFKYRFFNTESDLVNDLPALKGIHFAYTQTSFWDLESDSKPFQDTSYKPELFFLSPNIDTMFSSVKGFFIQTGLEHESNGMAAEESRSTNYLYFNGFAESLTAYDVHKEAFRIGLAVIR